VLQSNPLDDLSQSGKIVVDVRKRKGMNPAVPPLSDYEVRARCARVLLLLWRVCCALLRGGARLTLDAVVAAQDKL
jgi:hypothetical protein